MPKRPSRDSQSESAPSSKRTSQQQYAGRVQAAQDPLGRLDFKTAGELCTQVSWIDRRPEERRGKKGRGLLLKR